jgi:hypothetical protein
MQLSQYVPCRVTKSGQSSDSAAKYRTASLAETDCELFLKKLCLIFFSGKIQVAFEIR